MAFGVLGQQVERIRHFAVGLAVGQFLEDVDSTGSHHLGGELRLIPADVERRDDVVEEVAGDTEGIIPVLAEAEEAVGIPGALGGELELGAQPHIPIDEIVALGIRAGAGLDGPVPLALGAVAVVGTLAHDHLADHAVGDGLLGLPPDVGGSGLRADLENSLGLFHGGYQLAGVFVGVDHGFFEIDVLALVHGVHGHLAVPVVGGGDDDRVHIALVEEFAVVQVALHVEFAGHHLLAFFVDIAGGDDLAGIVLLAEGVERVGVVAAAAAAADDADVDAVIGADHAAPAHLAAGFGSNRGRGGGEREAGSAHGFEKAPAIERIIR